jgi:outer membrane protein assembly factor BamB
MMRGETGSVGSEMVTAAAVRPPPIVSQRAWEVFGMKSATKFTLTANIATRFKTTTACCAKLALAGSVALAVLGFGASVAAAGPSIFITDFGGNFGTLKLENGVYSPIGTTSVFEITGGPGGGVHGFDGSGGFYSVASNGTDTFIRNTGLFTDEPASKPDGTIYMDDLLTHDLYRINPKTGATSLVGSTGFANPPGGVLFLTLIAGQTDTLYGITTIFKLTGGVLEHSRLYQIDRTTGTARFIVDVNDDNVDCALIAGGTAYLFDNTAQVSTLNLATGAVSPLYDLSASLGAIAGIALVPARP